MFLSQPGIWSLPGARFRTQDSDPRLWRGDAGQAVRGARGPESKVKGSDNDGAAHDDRVPVRLRDRWSSVIWNGVDERKLSALVVVGSDPQLSHEYGTLSRTRRTVGSHLSLLLLLFFVVFPLKDTRPAGAQAWYDHVLRLFQSGSLAESQREAELGFERSKLSDVAWASKFQLLEAESMLWRGMYQDALGVLKTYPGSQTVDAGVVEKLAIEAVALGRLQQIGAADQRLIEAETRCSGSEITSCGSVFAARAILAVKEGQFARARRSFFQAFSFASRHHDLWLQVSTSLNVGWVDLQTDHYDDAVSWSESAYRDAIKSHYE